MLRTHPTGHGSEPAGAFQAVRGLRAAPGLGPALSVWACDFGGGELFGAEGTKELIQAGGLGCMQGRRGRGQNAACAPRHLPAGIPVSAN